MGHETIRIPYKHAMKSCIRFIFQLTFPSKSEPSLVTLDMCRIQQNLRWNSREFLTLRSQ